MSNCQVKDISLAVSLNKDNIIISNNQMNMYGEFLNVEKN